MIRCEHRKTDPDCWHRKDAGMVFYGEQWRSPEAVERSRARWEYNREWHKAHKHVRVQVCGVSISMGYDLREES